MSIVRTAALLAALASPALAQEPLEDGEPEAGELPPLTKEPELLDFVQAPYPPEAREAGVEGEVLLLVEVDETGAVAAVEVLAGLGHGLDEAAAEAARQFRFSPAEDETGPVPVVLEFAYGFVLDAGTVEEALPEEAPAAEADTGGTEAAEHEAPVNLQGTVVEMGTRRPLEAIQVSATLPDGSERLASTDGDGAWSFHGVPPGEIRLRARYPGYKEAERSVEVVEGELTEVRLWLKDLSYREDEALIVYERDTPDVTRRTLSVDEIRRIPGTFGDPVRVVQTLPGAARSPFGTGLLVIRGSNPEDSGVYIDGIRIPLIYHLGGYVSVINADLVEAVDYLPGGYGVRYGRSTGGVIDVTTKRFEPADLDLPRTKVTWSTDLLDSGGMVQTTLGEERKTHLAVAGRRSYIDAILPPFLEAFNDGPTFTVEPIWWDYQLKLDRTDADKDPLSVFWFGFQDTLTANTPPSVAQGTDPDAQGDLGTLYGTHRGYVRWEHELAPDLDLLLTPSLGYDLAEFSLGSALRVRQQQIVLELRAETPWELSEAVTLTPGVDLIAYWWDFDTRLPFNPDSFADFDPLDEREDWTIGGAGMVYAPDAFLEAQLRPFAERDRLLLTPGVRLSVVEAVRFDPDDRLVVRQLGFDPRLLSRFGLTEATSLKGATGIYTQPAQPFEGYRPSGVAEVGMERAWSSELGVEQRLAPGLQGDLSVFYKQLDQLLVPNPEYTGLEAQYFVNEGVGRVYGAELILRQARVDRFFGWVSYTLSRSERNDYPDREPDEGDAVFPGDPEAGTWYPYELDQTHILVAVAGYALPRDWEVSAKVQYVTGNPYTPYGGGVYDVDQDFYYPYATASYNSERLPDFFALDLRVDRLWTFKRWQLETYLDLLNVVRGVNPEFQLYSYDYTEERYVRGLPFIPSPGFEARFDL